MGIGSEATPGPPSPPNIKSFISCSNSHNSSNVATPFIYQKFTVCQRSVCLKQDNEIYVSSSLILPTAVLVIIQAICVLSSVLSLLHHTCARTLVNPLQAPLYSVCA